MKFSSVVCSIVEFDTCEDIVALSDSDGTG